MAVCEAIYLATTIIDDTVPIHLEVLLPAVLLGCVMKQGDEPPTRDAPRRDARALGDGRHTLRL